MSSKSKRDSFKKGDRVSARWSGSNIFYDAKVVDVTSRNYKVQYDDGSVSSLKFADVKKLPPSKETPPKTTKTSKSRSRSRSAGRPARSRSRSRSPARREKKAPATKTTKKSPKEEKEAEASPSNSNSVETKTVSRDSVDGILSKITLTRERVGLLTSETSTVTAVNSLNKEKSHEGSSSSERPRSTRLAALRSAQVLKVSNAIAGDKSKYSDDEEEEEEEEEDKLIPSPTLSKAWQTLYFIATLLKMVLGPVSLLFLVFACTKRQCTVLDIPQFYSRWRDFFNSVKYPLASIFAFHLLQAALSLVPFGRKVPSQADKNSFEYRMNGFVILLLHIAVFGACSYFGVYTNWGYDKFRAIALSGAIYSLICAITLHIYAVVKGGATIKSKVPFLGGFYNGLFTNPVLFGKLDIKTSFIRAGFIGSVLLNLSIVLKFFLMKGYVTVPLALTSGMQVVFVIDLFLREEKWLTTATYTTDSLGYAFIMTTGFLVPVGLAIQNIYLFTYEAKSTVIPHWCSGAMLCLFIFGYCIYLISTNMKHNFRRYPFSPSFAGIVSIPTSKQKRRLIASGLWGRMRHPNYVGLFIMALAWTLPCGIAHFVPYGPLVLLAIALVIRSFRIEAECLEKYGPAWKNYTEKVRSRLIPFIF